MPPEIAFSPWVDPTGWLGRQYTAYEHLLMMGPEPKCHTFSKVKIGNVFYRTRHGDKGKTTTQCFVRAMLPKTDNDADEEWEDRYDLNHEFACFIAFQISLEYVFNMSSIRPQYASNIPHVC